MNKKNFLMNLLMVMTLIALVLGAVFLKTKIGIEEKKNEKVVLKDVLYGSDIMKVGFTSATGLIENFVSAFNDKSGEQLAQMMDLVAKYIYSDCEYELEFDKKYEEKLSNDIDSEELIIMQYSLKQEEDGIIEFVKNGDVQLTLMENSQIQDISEYLSKMTAKIRTTSVSDNVDEIDTLEFLLLHRDGIYRIINYEMIDSIPYTE